VAILAESRVVLAAMEVAELVDSAVSRNAVTVESVCEGAFFPAANLFEQMYHQDLRPQSCVLRPPCESCGRGGHDALKCTWQIHE